MATRSYFLGEMLLENKAMWGKYLSKQVKYAGIKYTFASTVLFSNTLTSFVMYFFSFCSQTISQPLRDGSPVMLPSFNVVSWNRPKSSSTSLNSLIDLSKYFREFSTISLWVWDDTTVAKCCNIVVASFNE